MQLSIRVLTSVITVSTLSGCLRTSTLKSYSSFNLTEIIDPTSLQQVYDVVNALLGTNISTSAIDAATIQEKYLDVAVHILANSFLGLSGQLCVISKPD